MTRAEFEKRMLEIDNRLADREIPALLRAIHSWFEFMGKDKSLSSEPPDRSKGPYEWPNLSYRIEEWYEQHYPVHSVIHTDWGKRHFLIRGEVFAARMPLAMNAFGQLDVFDYLQDLSESVRDLLSEEEKTGLQETYNAFYTQASDIALCWTVLGRDGEQVLVHRLLDRGWADLRGTCESFMPNDPTAVLFSVQQAVEKFLKAFLAFHSPGLTEGELKGKYGHKVKTLLQDCAAIDDRFEQFLNQIDLLSYGTEVRYERQRLGKGEVIHRMDLAFAVCHAAAWLLLQEATPKSS